MNLTFDWNEVDSLIDLLHDQGVSYLMGNGSSTDTDTDKRSIDPVQLLLRLTGCGYPLVENATISLLILHPELAFSVEEALQQSTDDTAENLAVVTLAALYLQQWWLFRLTFALGHLPSFSDAPFTSLWQERHLPHPSSGYGLDGLLELQAYQQQRYSLPLNFLDDWQNQINHLLAQEEAHHRVLSNELRETLRQLSISD